MSPLVENNSFEAQRTKDLSNNGARPFEVDESLSKRPNVGRREIEFVAFLAHEMRNPLGAIRTAATLLTLPGSDAAARSRRIIERQADNLLRMIDDLLELARGRVGHVRLEPVQVDLADVVREVLEARAPQLQARRQVVQTSGSDEPVEVFGDPMRLTQVVANLVDNASKFSADGQVVRLALRRRAHTVELSVSDDGIGIEASMLDHVFDPFEHGVRSPRADHSGLGIGLAIVRELTELHGGRIVAESAGPGRGSRFVVTLPASLDCAQSSTSGTGRAKALAVNCRGLDA